MEREDGRWFAHGARRRRVVVVVVVIAGVGQICVPVSMLVADMSAGAAHL